jgi:MFS family permease
VTRLRESFRAFHDVFENPNLRRLQLAWAGSMIGSWAYGIALLVYAFEADGAYAVGILGLVRWLFAAAVAPFAGLLGDRYSRKRVMVVSDLVRAAALGMMAAVVLADGPSLAVYALATGVTLVGTAFRPAQAALTPSLARTPEELTASNVTASSIEGVGIFVGPALGGLLLALTSAGVVFVVTAATLLWSALMIVRIFGGATPERGEQAAGVGRAVVEGFRTVVAEPSVRLVVGLFSAQTFVDGALNVLIVVLALDVLAMGESGVGFLNSAGGIGGVIGAVGAAALVGRARLAADFGFGIVLWGIPIAAIGIWPNQVTALVLLGLVGAGNTIVDVAGDTLLQRTAPDEVLARVFGVMESLMLLTVALGSLAAPLMISGLGTRGALVVVGLVLPIAAALSWRRLNAIDAGAEAPPAEVEFLRSNPIFAPLPVATQEYLASQLVPVVVRGGEQVFRAGGHGDRFYLIGEGRVRVEPVDGEPSELGPGESFGEIALLRDVPRTATVSAVTDVRLYALDREDFIGAVTGHPLSREAAEAVVGARLGQPRPRLAAI